MSPSSRARTWRPLYLAAGDRLGSRIEARRIVEEAASGSWPQLLDQPVSVRAQDYFSGMVDRRAAGEPLQYVIGRWGFRHLDLIVDRRVLIPRPETEHVVGVALTELARLSERPRRAPVDAAGTVLSERGTVVGEEWGDPVVVDLGTGSGAIALSLAAEARTGAVWATDCSSGAIAIARANLAGLGGFRAAKVRLAEGWWWDALPLELAGTISLVVSNPPYISSPEMQTLPGVVADWEPALALDAGPRGLEAIEVIIAGAPRWLARPGTLVVEMAPHQAVEVQAAAAAAGFDAVTVEKDLTGRDRALVARIGH